MEGDLESISSHLVHVSEGLLVENVGLVREETEIVNGFLSISVVAG